jgi:hypothetical protein
MWTEELEAAEKRSLRHVAQCAALGAPPSNELHSTAVQAADIATAGTTSIERLYDSDIKV